MPNYLDVEPDQLRRMAQQHDSLAADIRKWGEIPHDWLAEFQSTYGVIADPMRGALVDYYNRRHQSAERLAARHERTRDELLAAAAALENADHSGGQNISHAGDLAGGAPRGGPAFGAPPGHPTPVGAGPHTPTADGPQPNVAQPGYPPATSVDPRMPEGATYSDSAPVLPAASAPQLNDPGPAGVAAPQATMPGTFGVPQPGWGGMPDSGSAGVSVGPLGALNGVADVPIDMNGHAGVADGLPAPMAGGTAPATVSAGGGGAGTAVRPPAPLATGPLAAALHPAEDRRALPSLVVGEGSEDDLALARTLLAATLSAVADSAPGLDWGVAVLRTVGGPLVLLTSTEGRGWLPPRLFLPSEVVIPWRWDSILRAAGRQSIAALEGTTDPARMLAEFCMLVGERRRARISALVSSAAIADDLRRALGDDVAIEDRVSAAESAVDLTSPGAGLADRLTLAGSDDLLREASTVPDAEIGARCVELARAADAQVRTAFSVGNAGGSPHRARILDALQAGLPVPESWWHQIRTVDALAAASARSRRIDISHIPVGGVPPNVTGMEVLRAMVFERRVDELLLLLAEGEPDRQTLRDALYTYGQITEHPLFPAAVRVSAAPAIRPGSAVSDVAIAPGVRAGSRGVSSMSHGEAPPSVAGLLSGPAGSESSGEQRRAR
ncbi:type VII secretion target [Nocardia beijingensis]|uniref:type VII secretion target n=1 Tax=Nocardia beijingensis TaxID=95162 RepID=UPI00082B9011|nr:type VII secretion target [Nocardia beijingensis]